MAPRSKRKHKRDAINKTKTLATLDQSLRKSLVEANKQIEAALSAGSLEAYCEAFRAWDLTRNLLRSIVYHKSGGQILGPNFPKPKPRPVLADRLSPRAEGIPAAG